MMEMTSYVVTYAVEVIIEASNFDSAETKAERFVSRLEKVLREAEVEIGEIYVSAIDE